MSREELYNSLKSDQVLSRSRIDDHISGKSEIDNSLLDSFDQEALEGWIVNGGKQIEMTQLDKRFISKGRYLRIYFSIFSILLAVGIFFFLSKSTYPTRQKSELKTNKSFVEETDLYLVEKFDTLVEKRKSNIAEIKILQENQVEQPLITTESQVEAFVEIEKIPRLRPSIPKTSVPKNLTFKKKIKEIYLSEFKLVDYRAIRPNPLIQTKQLDLTGTAANKENGKTEEEDPVWILVDVPYIEYIEKSMSVLNQSDLKKTLARFEVVLETYPDDINALFYSGFSYFNLGEFELANSFFTKSLQNPIANFDEESYWYLGLCFEKMGRISAAKEIFLEISQSSSYYAKEAQKKMYQKL